MTTKNTDSWILRADEAAPASGVPNDVEYHRVYAGEKRRIIRGIIAIVLLFLGLIIFSQLFLVGATLIDQMVLGRTGFTPLKQAAGALSLVLLIPYSMLLQRLFYGLPPRSMHSVDSRFRYGVFGRSLLVFGPIVLLTFALVFITPADSVPWTTIDLVALFVIGMLLIPLAAAGEEYGFRGFMFRVVGSWTRGSVSGAALGIALTTISFSLLHGTLDPYLLGSYLILFSTMGIVTWRTGGLEVAVVLHGIYNLTSLMLATTLHLDLGGALGARGDIQGTPVNLIPGAGLIVIAAIVWLSTRRSGPARTPAI